VRRTRLAAPRPAAGDHGGQPVAAAVHRRALLQDVDEALLASGMSPVLLQLRSPSMMMRNV
jgi:hypothetical protein